MAQWSAEMENIHSELITVLKRSYAPYSKLHVGCALKVKSPSTVIFGVNVENASYGGTICAERSAILSAISQFGPDCEFEWALVISDLADGPIPPCGLCLQVFKEFVSEDFAIHLGTEKAIKEVFTLREFLPHSFSSRLLP